VVNKTRYEGNGADEQVAQADAIRRQLLTADYNLAKVAEGGGTAR